jgi:hypothetical protein
MRHFQIRPMRDSSCAQPRAQLDQHSTFDRPRSTLHAIGSTVPPLACTMQNFTAATFLHYSLHSQDIFISIGIAIMSLQMKTRHSSASTSCSCDWVPLLALTWSPIYRALSMFGTARHRNFNCLCGNRACTTCVRCFRAFHEDCVPLQESHQEWHCPACSIALSESHDLTVSAYDSGVEDVSSAILIHARVAIA